MNENDLHDKIDRYLDAHLPDEERQAFEHEIAQNPLLAEEVKKHRLERETLGLLLTKDYTQKIKGWSNPVFEKIRAEENTRSGKIFHLYPNLRRYAAALAGVLLIGSLFVWSQWRFSNSAIYAQNFIDPKADLLDSNKGSDGGEPSADTLQILLVRAKMAYKNGQFAEGIDLLNDQLQTEESAYCLGHLYLAQKEYGSAIAQFRQVADIKGRARYKAEYYTLLAMLKNDQTDARFYRLLTSICTDAGHPYQKQAEQIRRSLQSGWRILIDG